MTISARTSQAFAAVVVVVVASNGFCLLGRGVSSASLFLKLSSSSLLSSSNPFPFLCAASRTRDKSSKTGGPLLLENFLKLLAVPSSEPESPALVML
jgi:hypothetical protein